MSPGGPRRVCTIGLALLMVSVGWASVVGAQPSAEPEPYHNYETMKEDMRALAEEHSEVANFEVHGQSALGNELYHVDVANNIENRSEEELAQLPTLYVDGLHHGNEILSGEAAYYFLQRVLANATEDETYLEGKRLVVNPVVNADGFLRDQRENANGVDLNRNYPFHWGRYGTSDAPFTGTYRGPSAASEPETQANMELMESLNMYSYLTGHTGTYDIVLPWDQDEDGEIPDWSLYETTLGVIENETTLEYRDPSGAGEAHAWGYGNRTAFAILPEVSTEQFAPASRDDVEQRLNQVLQVYRIVWENLTHASGGAMHVEEVANGEVHMYNDGWGPAYNVTFEVDTDTMEPENSTSANSTTIPPRIEKVEPGENVTLPLREGATAVTWERVQIDGDSRQLSTSSAPLPATADTNATQASEDGPTGVPGPGVAVLAAVLSLAALARRRR